MRPIVDRLQEQYGDRVTFRHLNARDGSEGEAAFKQLSLLGHPAFVVFAQTGQEIYRSLGIVDQAALEAAIKRTLKD